MNLRAKLQKKQQLQKRSSYKDVLIDTVEDSMGSEIDIVSLSALGVFLYFDDVSQSSSRELSEFIIKANFAFPDTTPLTIMINSYGGDVYSGFAAIDIMGASRLPIQTIGVGAICSMASLILTSGTPGRRLMSKNSYIMTHAYSSEIEGNYHDFVAVRKSQDEMHKRFINHFVKHSNMTEKQVKTILLSPTDRWITAEEALKYGLCDMIKDPWDKNETL